MVCFDRLPSSADVYVYPGDVTENLHKVTPLQVIRDGVTEIVFRSQVTLSPGDEVLSNAALLKLDKPYFANSTINFSVSSS